MLFVFAYLKSAEETNVFTLLHANTGKGIKNKSSVELVLFNI